MKTVLYLFVGLLFSTTSYQTAIGQEKKISDEENTTPYRVFSTYSDPAPDSFSPISIDTDAAITEKDNNKSAALYSQEYLLNENITDLLGMSGCVGIRIYNSLDAYKNGKGRVIAVPVKADGSEIVSIYKQTYLMSQTFEGSEIECQKLYKSNARNYVTYSKNAGGLHYQSAFYSKSELNALLSQSNAIGIKIMPGSRKYTDSQGTSNKRLAFLLIAVENRNNVLTDIGSNYLKSNEPCPTYCPKIGTMLVD